MKKYYFLSLLQSAFFLFISFLLQSCGGSSDLSLEAEEEPSIMITIEEREEQGRRKRARIEVGEFEQGQEINSSEILPLELWQYIFSYLVFEGALSARAVNRDFNELITGFREVGVVGIKNKPAYSINTRKWIKEKEINFNAKSGVIRPKTIPSFAFYRLIGKVKDLPQVFWPYLQETQIHTININRSRIGAQKVISLTKHLKNTRVHTLDLKENKIDGRSIEEFVKYLQGTRVHTIDLCWNQLGDEGAEKLAKHLQKTRVHTVNLHYNQIGAKGAEGLAKYLQKTRIHTINLSGNNIGAQGAMRFAKYLKGTQIHILNLAGNKIGDQGAIGFAKHLQGACVYVVNLSYNQISGQGAKEFAKKLQGTNVHTVDLSINQIGEATQQLLIKEYPHMKWIF